MRTLGKRWQDEDNNIKRKRERDKSKDIVQAEVFKMFSAFFLPLLPFLLVSHMHFPPSITSLFFSPLLYFFFHLHLFFSLSPHLQKNSNYGPTVGRGTCKWLKERESEEKERVDRLIRFRELKVYCHRVCVSGRQEDGNNLSLPLCPFTLHSLLFSPFHLFTFSDSHFFPHPAAKEPNSIINSENFSLKSDPGTASLVT